MEEITKCLIEFIDKPDNDILNYNLAVLYDNENQKAAAFSYYLRCAEFTNDRVLASECLLRCSLCINKQGGRCEKELYFIEHSITASPNSLEPYIIASRFYSWRSGNTPEKRQWLKSYMYACLGINILENNLAEREFNTNIENKNYELYYQKAYAGANIGKINEAREIFIKILQNYELSDSTKNLIIMKLNELPEPNHPIIPYSKNNISKLKVIFNNSEKIYNNFSQIYQDMFVLSMHNGKMNGTYLEIGAGDYKYGNNTYLLESEFNWTGVSIDFNLNLVNNFNQNRNNNCICRDGTTIDYLKLLKNNYKCTNIDYLQLDCDPPNITFDILSKIPFDQYKFGVITYEHDFYNDITGTYREKSREFLKEKGYKLIAGNISPYGDKCPFEDWWIHPQIIDENIWKLFEREDDKPINGEKYMLTKNEIINNHMISINTCVKPKIISENLILSNTILDNFQIKNKEILNLNTKKWYENLSGINEYRFYSYLSTLFNNIVILDIGTGFGISAVALSHNETNNVISYNLINQIRDNSKIYTKKNITFKIKNVLEDLTEDFIKNIKIILIDIDHIGDEEREIINRLERINYSGIVLLDDIHHPWEKEGRCMKQLWESINYTKYDITKYGHRTGTGIFFMNFNINIIEEKVETTIDTKQVAFWDNQLCERGTTTGLYNYAYYNERILGNKSYIFYEKNNPNNNNEIIEKFKQKFAVFPVENFKEVDSILLQNQIKHIFIIKSGQTDGKISKVSKNCIQCVFDCNEPHGEVFCSISIDVYGNDGKYPVLPRIVTLPEHNLNMRQQLNIPKNAIVFGGYGGKAQFDIHYVQEVVYEIAKNNKNIYFLFANFNKFCQDLPNIIHLPCIVDPEEKVRFINSCDAMLWARSDGETFGQSIAEFSIRNKPIIATKVGRLSHVAYLGDKGIWYNDEKDLTNILLNFNPEIESQKDWNAYKDYTPEKVMKIFDDVFLKNNITQPKTNYTFCTFWFDIGDKNLSDVKNSLRSREIYLNSFKKLVNKCTNLYVWCDNKMYEDIKHLQTDNVIIKQKNITELPLYKKKTEIIESITEMYKNKEQTRFSFLFKNHQNIEAIANYLIIVNSKFYMIKTIKDINPFNSHLFSWIDLGIFQHNLGLGNYNKLIPNYTETLNIIYNYDNLNTTLDIEDKLYIYGNQKTEFACGIFTINLKFIDNLCKNYYKYIDSLLVKKIISSEQAILTLFCRDYNLFNAIDICQGSYNSLQKLIKRPFTIGLALLTHNRPAVLDRTLKSYKEKKFFDFFDEKIILLQENLPETRNVAEKYDLEIYSTDENIGIGPGNNFLIDKLNTDYFIICQDDFILIEDNFTSEILESIYLIEKNKINCARMRNICNPGEPCYASNRLPFPEGDLPLTHISNILYKNYIINPEKKYGEIFKKYNENTYIISSKYANYTENPCVYKREWYKNNFYELNKVDGRKAENNIQNIWEKNEYMIGMGRGIFSHNDKIPSPKIIDCFIFYNELDLLNYRLNLLDDYVDKFILVEATHTHTGKEKKLFYNENKNLFEKFKDKIIHIIVDDFPHKYPDIDIEKNQQWRNENYQRNCIKRGIDKLLLEDNDIITICDLDEIPNPEILKEIKDNKKLIKLSSLKMDMYYYNLNCKTCINDWISPKIISYKEFRKLDITIHDFRYKKTDNIIENGGWHLSFFGDLNFIKNKIQSLCEQEFNNNEIINNIEEKIKSNKDLFNRENHNIQYINIEDNDNLPPKYDIYLQKYFSLDNNKNTNLIKDLYDYIPCHDQIGNDIFRVNKENLQRTLLNVSNNPSIVAINTQGYVKNHIENLQRMAGWGWNVKTNESDGIYIKKTINDTLIKCSKSSIPVLGALVCTTTKWIEKQIQSIDFPIENYIIINNNENFLAEKLDILVSKGNKFIKNFKVYHMPYNLGCAEGWNTIIKSFLFSPYWVIVNDDVSFTPGFLKELHETALENEDVGLIHGKPCVLNYLTKFGSFDMFLIRDWVIKDIGLFDTNFYPAYVEDCDYIFRLRNSSVKIINQLKHKYYHGDTFDYFKSGQNTIKFSNKLSNKLIDIQYKNLNYFYKKWNILPELINESNINDIYKYPFNNPDNKLSMISYDIEFARDKSLHDVLPSC